MMMYHGESCPRIEPFREKVQVLQGQANAAALKGVASTDSRQAPISRRRRLWLAGIPTAFKSILLYHHPPIRDSADSSHQHHPMVSRIDLKAHDSRVIDRGRLSPIFPSGDCQSARRLSVTKKDSHFVTFAFAQGNWPPLRTKKSPFDWAQLGFFFQGLQI